MGRIEGGGGGAFAHHHAQMGSLAVQGRGKKKREPASSNQVKEALYSREVVTLYPHNFAPSTFCLEHSVLSLSPPNFPQFRQRKFFVTKKFGREIPGKSRTSYHGRKPFA